MSDHDHDAYRELSALRLYDELDGEERVRLERHLAACPDCAAHARELEAGLGRLAGREESSDLPTGWRERLEREVAPQPRRQALRSPLWVAAASFLAGATLAWSVTPPRPAPPGPEPVASLGPPPASGGAGFERSTPPPRARDRGTLPLLELYLGR